MMNFEREVAMTTMEIMDLLKEDLLLHRIRSSGYTDLTEGEEEHLLELYKILKPICESIIATQYLQNEVTKIRKENK